MPKVVALQAHMGTLAELLRRKGYKVIDLYEAGRPGVKVDALLYTGYHPDITTTFNSLTETADITIGTCAGESHPAPVRINITGLRPEAALAALEERLRHFSP
ncbi:MBL fold metallo-hydrolase [Sporolituus thermophilus]|uniref:Uncharacterized protein n=1 Tax=Sporolituus thermophilus DSM 23256 TaxID=1123285 RepID=A0A1G7MSE5_9FIRM|nr:MBL fold metallo-hydrolase [Sporolituus thermophilus]SDF64644.1 Uncharacterised protein family (UPF0180) [Sporolituus thermophilus DSM 23256]